jgi:hypothetical protein
MEPEEQTPKASRLRSGSDPERYPIGSYPPAPVKGRRRGSLTRLQSQRRTSGFLSSVITPVVSYFERERIGDSYVEPQLDPPTEDLAPETYGDEAFDVGETEEMLQNFGASVGYDPTKDVPISLSGSSPIQIEGKKRSLFDFADESTSKIEAGDVEMEPASDHGEEDDPDAQKFTTPLHSSRGSSSDTEQAKRHKGKYVSTMERIIELQEENNRLKQALLDTGKRHQQDMSALMKRVAKIEQALSIAPPTYPVLGGSSRAAPSTTPSPSPPKTTGSGPKKRTNFY